MLSILEQVLALKKIISQLDRRNKNKIFMSYELLVIESTNLMCELQKEGVNVRKPLSRLTRTR